MNQKLITISFLVFSASLSAQICDTKLTSERMKSFVEKFDKNKCGNPELLVASEGQFLPLRKIPLYGKLSDVLIMGAAGSSKVKVEGKFISASQISLFLPACKTNKDGKYYERSNQISNLTCKSAFTTLESYGEKRADFFKYFELINGPLYEKSKQSCMNKIENGLKENLTKYVKANGGEVVSVDLTQNYYRLEKDWGKETFKKLHWKAYSVKVKNKGKVSDLTLQFVLNDVSGISYLSPSVDPFGEYLPESERSAKAQINISRFPYNYKIYGIEGSFPGSEAILYNTKTKSVAANLEIPSIPCVEEVLLNQDNQDSPALNNAERGNAKADLPAGKQKEAASSSSSKQ